MVGVPGKSKGCSTCRRRKKGCDQKRPICGQCASSGYVCGGYQRNLTFVVHPASRSAEQSYYVPRCGQDLSLAIIPSLDKSAIETQCRALFWDLFLPHGTAEAHDGMLLACNHPPNWTSILLELTQDEPALEQAFSALSISRVGRSNNDIRLVKESTKLYGRALKDLQKALVDSTRAHTEEVLAACSLLGLYEVFESGDALHKSVGWISHAQGAARLIEIRGPSRHTNRQAHHVFLGARLPILYSAIVRRKRTFLAKEEWITVPWQDIPFKTYHDTLVDRATKIPGLLEDFDKLRALAHLPGTPHELFLLLQLTESHSSNLTKWEQGKKPMSRPVNINHVRGVDDTYPFDQEMSWKNHLFMNASLVYWTAQLILAVTSCQIELLLASLGYPQPHIHAETTSHQQRARQFATCIVQTMPYALMPDMGALGINHIAFPMCLAYQHFVESNEVKICSWLSKTCHDMKRQGVRVRSFEKPAAIGGQQQHIGDSDNSTEVREIDETTGVMSPGSDSNDNDIEWPFPPSSMVSDGTFKRTFIFENPAKYYIDTTEPE